MSTVPWSLKSSEYYFVGRRGPVRGRERRVGRDRVKGKESKEDGTLERSLRNRELVSDGMGNKISLVSVDETSN